MSLWTGKTKLIMKLLSKAIEFEQVMGYGKFHPD